MASAHSIARAGRHAAPCASSLTRVLPPPLSRVPRQETRSGQQRAHGPACDRVQRPHEPSVRREGREGERHHTHSHTHTHASTRASSLCMPLGAHARGRVASAGRYAATRILTDARAPAPSLSCAPQGTLSVWQRAHRPACDRVQRAHEP
jgi:hypothetical protein